MTRSPVLLPGQHASPDGPVDLMNMYVMHHAFRRDLLDFRSTVDAASVGDAARWQALARRWRSFSSALHSHHSAEDTGLWPLLLERATSSGDEAAHGVLEAMQAEHARIDPLLQECADGFTSMASEGTDETRIALADSLSAFDNLLDGHLGHEERDAMAVVQRYLTQADWAWVEKKHFRPAYSPRDLWFVIPWSQHGLPEDISRRALHDAGLPLKVLLRLTRPGFARHQREAFGPNASHQQPGLGRAS